MYEFGEIFDSFERFYFRIFCGIFFIDGFIRIRDIFPGIFSERLVVGRITSRTINVGCCVERFNIKLQHLRRMAGPSDYFSIGSTVACKTCYNQEIEGEVLAFDPQTKMLILSILLNNKSERSNNNNTLSFTRSLPRIKNPSIYDSIPSSVNHLLILDKS